MRLLFYSDYKSAKSGFHWKIEKYTNRKDSCPDREDEMVQNQPDSASPKESSLTMNMVRIVHAQRLFLERNRI